MLCLYEAQISGERLQDHWSSVFFLVIIFCAVLLLFIQEVIAKSLLTYGVKETIIITHIFFFV